MDDLRCAVPGGEKAGLTAIGSVRGNQEGRLDELVKVLQPVTPGRLSGKAGYAAVAQLVEHLLGKEEVVGSSPISSSIPRDPVSCRRMPAADGRRGAAGR